MASDRLAPLRNLKWLMPAIKITFAGAVVVFGSIYIASRWGQLRGALSQAKLGWLLLAIAMALIGLGFAMLGTLFSLSVTSGRRLRVVDAARVFFVSQLGKYIPGSVWPVIAVTAMTRRYNMEAAESAAGGMLALFLSLVAGGSLGIVLTLVALPGGGADFGWLLLLIPLAVVLARSSVVFLVLNTCLRLFKRSPLNAARPRDYFLTVGVSVVTWLFMGMHCWALCVALGADPGLALPSAVGGFALAYTAGTLFVPAPAGVGVREAVLTYALGGIISADSSFTAASVLAVVVLSRVVLALLDFLLAGGFILIHRFVGSRGTAAESNGSNRVGDGP